MDLATIVLIFAAVLATIALPLLFIAEQKTKAAERKAKWDAHLAKYPASN